MPASASDIGKDPRGAGGVGGGAVEAVGAAPLLFDVKDLVAAGCGQARSPVIRPGDGIRTVRPVFGKPKKISEAPILGLKASDRVKFLVLAEAVRMHKSGFCAIGRSYLSPLPSAGSLIQWLPFNSFSLFR